jgi:hypothetical protein
MCGLPHQYTHLLRSPLGADTNISYYTRIFNYLHEFVINEEDYRKLWTLLMDIAEAQLE